MMKIIFSDFDNTLLNYYSDKNYFDDYQISVLKKIQEKGIKFCIITGRTVSFFQQFSNLLEVVDYIIGSNGACVYDVKEKRFIYQDVINKHSLNLLIDYVIKNNHSFLLNCLDKRYQYGEWGRVNGDKYIEGKEYACEQMVMSFSKRSSDDVANFVEYVKDVVVTNTTDWGDEYSIDINNNQVSKGNSVKWLCNQLEVATDDTIGFGDGANDVSMFEVVGKSVAMGNATNNIKGMATDVVLNCEEYGVYKYIEDNILK